MASLLVLPLNSYSRRTYISENALLPGQVHTYFGGSDQHVFRAYKHEVNGLLGQSNAAINDHLEPILASAGLKVGRQNYTYRSAGETFAGENLYAILQAPRGDATEALVLVSPWRSIHDVPNPHGVALALALARYFRRWSLWSKDIIFLFPPDSLTGPQAWVDAYHDAHDGRYVSPLPRKSGALQGAVALDYTKADPADNDGNGSSRFTAVHIVYDGVNGQLPNLDLINSVVNIAGGQMGTGVSLQEMWRHDDGYADRLRTMLRGMLRQGLGAATGAHSAFMAYHVDAITLQPYTATALTPEGNLVISGWQHDEMAMGRILEGTFRSLNNLLEHLHQSFFFYLLMGRERFVSIGTYLPSAMLLAANFTIMAIALWVRSGQTAPKPETEADSKGAKDVKAKKGKVAEKETVSTSTSSGNGAEERDLFLPLAVVTLCQALGVVPLYLFNHVSAWVSKGLVYYFVLLCQSITLTSAAPHTRVYWLRCRQRHPATRHLPRPDHLLPCLCPAVRPHQVLLAAAARHVLVLARHSQLLARLPRWPAGQPPDVYAPGTPQRRPSMARHCPAQHCVASWHPGCMLRRVETRCCRGAASCSFRLGRLGHVHGRRAVVRLVAGMAGWVSACAGPASSSSGQLIVGEDASVYVGLWAWQWCSGLSCSKNSLQVRQLSDFISLGRISREGKHGVCRLLEPRDYSCVLDALSFIRFG